MRKIIATLLFICIFTCLAGCSESNLVEETSKNKIIRESDINYSSETEDSDVGADIDVTEESSVSELVDESESDYQYSGYKSGNYLLSDYKIDPVTLYNDNHIRVSVEEMIRDISGDVQGFVIYAGNDGNRAVTLNVKRLYINNLLIFMDINDIFTVEPGKDNFSEIGLNMEILDYYNIKDIEMISLDVEGEYSNGYVLFDTKLVDIKTSAYSENMPEPYLTDGEVVEDNDEIRLIAYGYNDEGNYCISLFVSNRSDKTMKLEGRNITIGGTNYGNIMRMSVPAGKCQHITFDLMTHPEIKADFAGSELIDVAFSVGYRFSNTIECDWESDVVTIDFE